jgi:hypothetical protein
LSRANLLTDLWPSSPSTDACRKIARRRLAGSDLGSFLTLIEFARGLKKLLQSAIT